MRALQALEGTSRDNCDIQILAKICSSLAPLFGIQSGIFTCPGRSSSTENQWEFHTSDDPQKCHLQGSNDPLIFGDTLCCHWVFLPLFTWAWLCSLIKVRRVLGAVFVQFHFKNLEMKLSITPSSLFVKASIPCLICRI